jgi:hypothetical protein
MCVKTAGQCESSFTCLLFDELLLRHLGQVTGRCVQCISKVEADAACVG